MGYQNMFSLEGKGIVVTGGCGYLGREIARALHDFGGDVVIADMLPSEEGDAVAEGLGCRYVACDLSKTDSVRDLYAEAENLTGAIDVLFNCAAYTGYAGTGDADSMPDDVWEAGISGTVGLTYRCTREVIPYMRKAGGGSIINFASLYAWIAPDFRTYPTGFNSPPNYGCGKAAIAQLTRHCASQFCHDGIRVNSITPGSFPHPPAQEHDVFMANLAGRTMTGRIGYPADLVGAAVLLASDASSYMTGSNIMVDGGTTAW